MMFKILIIAVIAWIGYNVFKASRFLRSAMSDNKTDNQVKNKKLKIDEGNVEDADFDDIDDNKKNSE